MRVIVGGIDAGSYSAKAVLVADGEILAWAIALAGVRSMAEAAEGALDQVLDRAGIARGVVTRVVATGSGASSVCVADEIALEVVCIARGAAHYSPSLSTVLDVGAEHCVAVECHDGLTLTVARTDSCAAGAGIFLKVVAEVLEVSLDDMGPMALVDGETAEIASRCAVFAESEIISLVHSGASKESIVRGVYRGLAARMQPLVLQTGGSAEVVVIGGGAEDVGLVAALEERLGKSVFVPPHPATVTALGAALVAGDHVD
jgi:(R)-2-hydroxyacyl-CoA dehydratese activating ATPase